MESIINKFVEEYFQNNNMEKAFDLLNILRNRFSLTTIEAYSVISDYANKHWETASQKM